MEYLGRIEFFGEGNVLWPTPGRELPDFLSKQPPVCTHCLETYKRQDHFLFETKQGVITIARGCLAAYLSSSERAAVLMTQAQHEFDGLVRSRGMHWVGTVLSAALHHREEFGWSRQQASRFVAAEDWFGPLVIPRHPQVDEIERWVKEDLEALPEAQVSMYEAGLCHMFRTGWCLPNQIGYVASSMGAYDRYKAEADQEKAAVEELLATGASTGTVGERWAGSVTVEKIIQLAPGEYGDRYLCKMRTVEGHLVVWFTGENLAFKEGETKQIRGTVRGHERFGGEAQTVVSRVVDVNAPKKPRKQKGGPGAD